MSEVLAQLEKKGEGLLPVTPDALYRNNSMSANTTATLVVTKKPRWILASFIVNGGGSSASYFIMVIDVKNNAAYRYGFFDNVNHDESMVFPNSYIPTVTDTAVTIKNVWTTCSVRVGAYY